MCLIDRIKQNKKIGKFINNLKKRELPLPLPQTTASIDHRNEIILSIYKNISFETRMDVKKYEQQVKNTVLKEVNKFISSDAGNLGIKIIDTVRSNKDLLVRFPKEAQKNIDIGRAVIAQTKDGTIIPIVKDAKTGKIIGHAKGVDKNHIAQLGNAVNVVVSVSHIISNYDNAKQLRSISKSLEKILAYMEIEKKSELESIYEYLGAVEITSLETHRPLLRDLKIRLKNLRNQWIEKTYCSLEDIKDPKDDSWFYKNRFFRSRRGDKIFCDCSKVFSKLWLINLTLDMERDISILLNEEDNFYKLVLPAQRTKMLNLLNLFNKRKKWIDKLCNDRGKKSRPIRAASMFVENTCAKYNHTPIMNSV